ncbi:Acetylglutamate kinase protein [Dioscorea alata]|uniref:Acetylglutamate kinase protein n=2 Tax=Dioscorea alata TaxID=55571 RepID=A0ACB7WPC3_DIOAL|nr:Acetylglutamate kinase protein [Dioscorea alata]KAH7690177.1 Acetylglutamate kinase protein [Dioscorea alata]
MPLHLHPLKFSIPPSPPIIASTTSPPTPAQTRVDILSESLPFIQRFRGKTIVVKYGGAAMKSAALQRNVLSDLVLLSCASLLLVLVHGGGPAINAWLLRTGHEPKFHNNLRVTDAHTMEVVEMVIAGKINKSLVAEINMLGGTDVGHCGKDARLLTVRPSSESTVLRFVSEIARVDPSVLHPILADGHIPATRAFLCVVMDLGLGFRTERCRVLQYLRMMEVD